MIQLTNAFHICDDIHYIMKLKRYNIVDPQLKQDTSDQKILRTIGISLAFGTLAGFALYLSTKTVEYSIPNYTVMAVSIAAVPTVSVILS